MRGHNALVILDVLVYSMRFVVGTAGNFSSQDSTFAVT